ETIRAVDRANGYLLDPHSAVGLAVARRQKIAPPVVALATAHAAKFPDAIKAATGKEPALPPHFADLSRRPEQLTVLPADQAAVARFVVEHSRVAEKAAS
ncbi:MAG TPA: threonine synthase, partial [Xanthobacteraceae bacterium]|nr:threonine synthase [Xanthobacteraceae bacterium]